MAGEDANEQWQRDLEWAIDSPFLMGPAPLGPWSCPRQSAAGGGPGGYSGHRVGAYFESLVGHWLERVCEVEILAQGLQVVDDGRTLGELDFVFRAADGLVNHWEVAVKFYLYHPHEQVAGSHFIGPNAGDTFERKRQRLLGHQLPLSERVFGDVDTRAAFVKGRIFYHPLQPLPEERPDGMMADHLRGTWIHRSELGLLEERDRVFRIAEKPNWLAPEQSGEKDAHLMTFHELLSQVGEHFSNSGRPILLSSMVEQDGGWGEFDRVFVVADQWPR